MKHGASAHFDRGPGGGRALGGQHKRLLARFDAQQKEAAKHFLDLGKGTIDDAHLAAHRTDPRRAIE